MQEDQCDLNYQDQDLVATLFFEVAQNNELIIGKIAITPKRSFPSFPIRIQIKGLYTVETSSSPSLHENSLLHLRSTTETDVIDTLNTIEAVETRRKEKSMNLISSSEKKIDPDDYECSEYFLEGEQRITHKGSSGLFESNQQVVFPFTFSLPPELPPSLETIHFASKIIEIKYFIVGESCGEDEEKHRVYFPVSIKSKQQKSVDKSSQICRSIQYRCFNRFCCGYRGTYQVEVVGAVLGPGKLQVVTRVYREGKKTERIIGSLQVTLKGELKGVKQINLGSQTLELQFNEFQMLEGETIFTYDSNLRSVDNNLFSIRFWLECEVELLEKMWLFTKNDFTNDVII